MKTALSHDWLNGMRGGEKCLEVFCRMFPGAPIFTLFYEKGKVSDTITAHPICPSPLQKFPFIFSHYRNYLPFFSAAVETFDLKGYELVISTSHCVAKGVRKAPGALHICYCFTPVRYAWALFDDYFGDKPGFLKKGIGHFISRLKRWDLAANARVDHFVAISEHVRRRIRDFYGRTADVIYPPVDTDFYFPDEGVVPSEDYLMVSALVPYKRADLAIRALGAMGRRLTVIGDGPERKKLERMAGPTIQFLGWQSNEELRKHYRRARAVIFPGEEDFGIVPLEAQACGRFVIAYAKGGALETVKDGKTGIFFHGANAEDLKRAVECFEKMTLDTKAARANAERFGVKRFELEMRELVSKLLKEKQGLR